MINLALEQKFYDAKSYSDSLRREELEITPAQRWVVYGTTVKEHSTSFYCGLPKTAPRLSEVVKELPEGALVADICAGTHALRSIQKPIRGVAIGLTDSRTREEENSDTQRGITLIGSRSVDDRTGDIFYPGTWDIFDQVTGGYVNLMIFRPAGGSIQAFRDLGEEFELEFLKFLCSKLASGGMAYLQKYFPRKPRHSELFQEWASQINSEGFKVKYYKRRSARIYVERV